MNLTFAKAVSTNAANVARSDAGCFVLGSYLDEESGKRVMLTLPLEVLTQHLVTVSMPDADIVLTDVTMDFTTDGFTVVGA